MILVDTTVWIDFFNGVDSPFRRALHQLIEREEDLCLCGPVLMEILQGFHREKDYRQAKECLLELPVFIPTIDTYLLAADMYRALKKKGKTLRGSLDCLIAAVAILHDLTLLHNDRDFDSISQYTELHCFKPVGAL